MGLREPFCLGHLADCDNENYNDGSNGGDCIEFNNSSHLIKQRCLQFVKEELSRINSNRKRNSTASSIHDGCPYCRDLIMSKFASRSVLNAYYAVLYSSHTTNNSNNQHSHNRCSSSFEFLHCLPHTPIHFESVDSVTPENFDICDNSTTDGDMDLRHLRPWWMQSSEDPIDTEQVLWWNLNNSLAEPNNYEMDTADEDEEEEESEGEEECYEDEDDEQCSDGGTPFDDMDNTNVYAIRNGQYVLQSLQEWLDNPRRPSRNNSQPAPLTERHLR